MNDYIDVHQFNFSMNNQFKIGNIYTANYQAFIRAGQETICRNSVSIFTGGSGRSKTRPKKERNVETQLQGYFHKNGMEGLTAFETSKEYSG